jgi:glutamate 5-kinase
MQTRNFPTGFQPRRIVVKLGTGILTLGIGQLDTGVIANICQQIADLRKRGLEVIVVSSGAVGLGMGRLGMKRRPKDLPTLQACASVGQSILIETWQKAFDPWGLHVGQMLLTRDDLSVRKRHVAVGATLDRLLKANIIPVINENDCISVDELKFGDNDVLSALVASLTKSDALVLLSTIPGFMNLATGEVIHTVEELSETVRALAQGTQSPTAVGGMISKLNAVHIATGSKCGVFIAHGKEAGILHKLMDGELVGTFFVPQQKELRSQKRWLAYFHKAAGSIVIDAGAQRALLDSGRSLLASGVTAVEGRFEAGDVIDILNEQRVLIARGVTCFGASELQALMGWSTAEIRRQYPDRKHSEVIHRDALALVEG